MIKFTKFETMRDYSLLTILSKLRYLLFLKEVELGWYAGLVVLIGLFLKKDFDSFYVDEP